MEKSEIYELIIKIRDNRDEIAFSKLFDFLAPKLKAYFLQNKVISENAEELTQEVLSTIWLKSYQYNSSKSAVSTWIYTIARNKKVDFYRKISGISHNEEDIREFLYENNKNDQIRENEIKEQVKKISNNLDSNQKKIIEMNFFENKSHKKIAQELEIPLGTVKSRIRNILLKIQKSL